MMGTVAQMFANEPSRLTVLREERQFKNGHGRIWCFFRCVCGTEKWIVKYSLKNTRSCGCLSREASIQVGLHSKTHGESKSSPGRQPEYGNWDSMLKRCYNPKSDSYHRYGGFNPPVTVCEEWRNSYEAFLRDMGRRPSPVHTLDRYPNPHGNYEPGNVRWATVTEQGRNRRENHLVTFRGKTQCVRAWEDELGFGKDILFHRLRNGMSVERALTQTYKPRRKKNA